jgi:hypothetical protein
MRVKITSDGESAFVPHTNVVDASTGVQIPRVTSVDIRIACEKSVPRAVVTVLAPMVDVVAEASIVERCPHCGHERPRPEGRG